MPVLEMTTRTGDRKTLPSSVVARLTMSLRGALLRPGDPRYDDVRRVWNGMIDHRPAIIVRCAETADVVRAVTVAREYDLLVSVRGGGHNIAGRSVCSGGLMIDLSPMRAIEVDAAQGTARVQGGATLGELDRATQRAGLATTAGVVSTTGVAGLTLGGGVGRLARKHGLACDNLLSVVLVTADGHVLRASESENPDLFWGLRGAGPNFGAVTGFEFQLHHVGPEVLGGVVVHPLARARQALRFYAEYSRSAPDELSADAFLLTSPDGEPVFVISVCYVGPPAQGERVLAPLRRFGPPVADEVGPMSYREVQTAGDAVFPAGRNYYWKSHFLDQVSDDAVDATVEHFAAADHGRPVIGFQQFGGAVSRVAPDATAFRHRTAQYDNFGAASWDASEDARPCITWVREWSRRLAPYGMGASYVNNLGDEGNDRVRAAYGGNYRRLVSLKTRYDPDNLFRLNANIQPRP